MKQIRKSITLALLALMLSGGAQAKVQKNSPWKFTVRAGANIGGTAPLDMPAEIRKINNFTPTLLLTVEGNVGYSLNSYVGLRAGIKLETKGMRTDAQVRNYWIEIAQGDAVMKGIFTGNVVTQVKNDYITLPIVLTYNVSDRWQLYGGGYISMLINGSFTGSAYNGYMREDIPTNEKVAISEASYDFSNEINPVDGGLTLGASFRVYRAFSLYADVTSSAAGIFPASFSAINFNMYNIYANFGFSYQF